MKKLIINVALVSLLLVGCNGEPAPVNEVNEIPDTVVEIELKTELKIESFSGSKTIELDDFEEELFLESKLVNLDYIDGVDRLVLDVDGQTVVMVYEDQTLIFNLNKNTYTLNYNETYDNDLIELRTGTLYLNMDKMSEQFLVDYEVIEEPFIGISIDFNSKRENYPVEASINAMKSDLPMPLNMTWEAVYSARTNVDNLYDMPGLDIISPVWYEVTNSDGTFIDKTQDDYIAWSKKNNYTLWPAITNSFDTDLTHELITSLDNRSDLIQNLVSLYKEHDFPGINIDFENIYKEDQKALSQYVAELTAAFHREGMLVSMDVTFPGGSDTWSKCYDHLVLGQWIDYMVVMSYDQHWGSSPVSGTVAGIEWLDTNFENLTEIVESDKLIMGIPFYMRVWFERPSKEAVNSMKVTSDAITMYGMENILENETYTMLWDEKNGQSYISYIDPEDNAVKKIWIEDEQSLRLKVALMHKYNMRGIASWRRGYELKSIWPALDEALHKGE